MNLAESTIMNAIRYSMVKNCFANIILAGPVYAGKRSMANLIAMNLNFTYSEKVASVFSEEKYFRELPENKFNVKDIDSEDAFDTYQYLWDVKRFLAQEYDKPKMVTKKGKENIDYIYGLEPKEKVNIFTGPHAIKLLKENVEIPEAIYIYVDADVQKCIQRRSGNSNISPNFPIGSDEWKMYFDFVLSQNERYILPQKDMADIIIRCD